MEQNFTLYIDKNHNCMNLTTSALLKRLGVKLEYIWGQSGLFFKDKGSALKVTPYYRSLTDDFSKHGINLVELRVPTWKDLTHTLKKLLMTKKSVAITVDIYELPYCISYKELHEVHEIEVLSIQDNKLFIADHYYHYYGEIDLEIIQAAFHSGMKIYNLDSALIYYVDIESQIIYSQKDLLRVVADNYTIMSGKPIEDLLEDAEDSKIGIEAIDAIIVKIIDVTKLEAEETKSFFDIYHRHLKEVSNARHHFHLFLKEFECTELAESVRNSSQNWAVVSNLLLRGYVLNDFKGIGEKILSRQQKLFEQEVENKKLMEQLLRENVIIN